MNNDTQRAEEAANKAEVAAKQARADSDKKIADEAAAKARFSQQEANRAK